MEYFVVYQKESEETNFKSLLFPSLLVNNFSSHSLGSLCLSTLWDLDYFLNLKADLMLKAKTSLPPSEISTMEGEQRLDGPACPLQGALVTSTTYLQ